MDTVISRDGTKIAFDRSGDGPPIIFVTGAFNDRSTCAPLAKVLEPQFTVITYDRRGRGDSSDTLPYAVEREVEDVQALIAMAGGTAFLFGYSSGARLALQVPDATKIALYEPPFDDQPNTGLLKEIAELIKAGKRADAVEAFQTKAVGLPAEMVAQIRQSPFFPALEAMAHTLVYDMTITNETEIPQRPALVLSAADTWPKLTTAAETIAERTGGEHVTVPGGANHFIDPEVVAPVLADWLTKD
jgi:pimeloyl-ACP methyl ester carboxylesterase